MCFDKTEVDDCVSGNCNSHYRSIHQEALRSICQYRTPNPNDLELIREVQDVRDDMQMDITNSNSFINPKNYNWCNCCGLQVRRWHTIAKENPKYGGYMSLLHNLTYNAESGNSLLICNPCRSSLNKATLPKLALQKGWKFIVEGTPVLDCLSPHEALLISLRLPCIPTWRTKGGFGQFASRGRPVCYSNLVSDIAKYLPHDPTKVFTVYLMSGVRVEISMAKVRNALTWLQQHNFLYKNITISETNLLRIQELENQLDTGGKDYPTADDIANAELEQEELGSHARIDGESIIHYTNSSPLGTEQTTNDEQMKDLITFVLLPARHRKLETLPYYDAVNNIESYFPVLFPYGRGGPLTFKMHLQKWLKHVIQCYQSKFAKNMHFLFFVHAVSRRRRLSGLTLCAPLRQRTNDAIIEVRDLLTGDSNSAHILKRVDFLLRSGALSASFETVRGTPAFWAKMGSTVWQYLTWFGNCHLFLTLSPADLIDPYVFMQADNTLSYQQASELSPKERADRLAKNPYAAATIFHRRVQSFLDHFLFGNTKPLGEIKAFLGRVEQQVRLSPHLHILIWLENPLEEEFCSQSCQDEAISAFIEQFNTAIIPPEAKFDQTYQPLAPVQQKLPFPSISSLRTKENIKSRGYTNRLRGSNIQKTLGKPFMSNIMDGSRTSNAVLRDLTLATQMHNCRSYCKNNSENSCRFMFPFPLQGRATVARRSKDRNDTRQLALCPRNDSYINSTHPMLVGMFRCNTDVTVITGNSIRESLYVCSYAVKTDKNPVIDLKTIQYLRKIPKDEMDNRPLLSKLSRSSESVRMVGAQEVMDNLIGNPLIVNSCEGLTIYTGFLLQYKGALSDVQWNQRFPDSNANRSSPNYQENLLATSDLDQNLFRKPEYVKKNNPTTSSTYPIPDFIELYMKRPRMIEHITASQFYSNYKVVNRTRGKDSKLKGNLSEDWVLFDMYPVENDSVPSKLLKVKYVLKRAKQRNRPKDTHMLNVVVSRHGDLRGIEVYAAALLAHFPFRTLDSLLNGQTITNRVQDILEREDVNESHSDLVRYIDRMAAMVDASNFPTSKAGPENTVEEDLADINLVDNTDDEKGISPFEDDDEDPLDGVPAMFTKETFKNPLHIKKKWGNYFHLNASSSQIVLDVTKFRKYLTLCAAFGVVVGNSHFQNDENVKNIETEKTSGEMVSIDRIKDFKKQLILNAKTNDQKQWLDSVISYIAVFYGLCPNHVPQEVLELTRWNHPIFTNAAGGTGKSWLFAQIEKFIQECVPIGSIPIFDQEGKNTVMENFHIIREDMPEGRFGKIAILAPSGVAAANCGGHTIHSALRTRSITEQNLTKDPSASVLQKLQADFSQVLCIFLDEYSMVSLTILAYLDRILRKLRPVHADVMFGGIPIIVSGDAYQLPPVRSLGILSPATMIPEMLQPIHEYFNCGVFFLTLTESVRQGNDNDFFHLLTRLRLASCTENDGKLLNTRVFNDLCTLGSTSTEILWGLAPILTSKNITAAKINNATISRNGSIHGTFILHNAPIVKRSSSLESKVKAIEKSLGRTTPPSTQDGFCPATRLVLYPGIPIMLRTNICPELGLCNGAIGRVRAIIFDENMTRIPPHETTIQAASRIANCSTFVEAVPSLLVHFPESYKGIISAVSGEVLSAVESKLVLIDPIRYEKLFGLPISIAHSFTIHKSQSLTLPSVIIDPKGVFNPGALYVAFSRARGLSSVALTAKVTLDEINKFAKSVERTTERLKNIETNGNDLQRFIVLTDTN